jgi:hypothetical protein
MMLHQKSKYRRKSFKNNVVTHICTVQYYSSIILAPQDVRNHDVMTDRRANCVFHIFITINHVAHATCCYTRMNFGIYLYLHPPLSSCVYNMYIFWLTCSLLGENTVLYLLLLVCQASICKLKISITVILLCVSESLEYYSTRSIHTRRELLC